jgi:hypothetical protein
MKRMTLTSLVLNIAALALMWAGALALFGMLAGAAWALLSWGWSLVQ